MAPSLETFPVEIFHRIVGCLGLRDAASLRLTCHNVNNKASGVFADFFKHKTVELTTKILEEFIYQTSKKGLPCLLQHCTITGIAYSNRRARRSRTGSGETTECIRLLSEAFRNMKRHTKSGGLASLHLSVAARKEGPNEELIEADKLRSLNAIWDVASSTFNITMAALKISDLPVEDHLDIFGSLKGCSLAFPTFQDFTRKFMFSSTFTSLKRFTLRLSRPQKSLLLDPTVDGKEMFNIQGRCSLDSLHFVQSALYFMPKLEFLDLHWYRIDKIITIHVEPLAWVLPLTPSVNVWGSPDTVSLHLKECKLRGIYTFELDLVRFLESVNPEKLMLSNVSFREETWTSVFAYLTSERSLVKHYHLDNLFERRRLVHFNVPGKSKIPYRQRMGPSTLERQGIHAKEAISYRIPTSEPLKCGQWKRWTNERTQDFGAPGHRKYDFVKLNIPKRTKRQERKAKRMDAAKS